MKKILIFVLGLLTACSVGSNKRSHETNKAGLNYDTSKVAIISWDSARYKFDKRGFTKGELTQKDLIMVDSLVSICVTYYNQELNLPEEHKDYEIDLSGRNYKRQLVVMINSKGEKEVWVNCFCHDWDRSWQTNILSVHDGGSCYFNLMINLTTQTCYDLSVNGLA